MVAGLFAEGTTDIYRLEIIERGYESVVESSRVWVQMLPA